MIFKKLIVFTFLFPVLLAAQKTLEFPAQIDKMAGARGRFTIDKVVDARQTKSPKYIGMVQKGMLNATSDAVLIRDLADELTTVIRQLLPSAKDSAKLILKVNRLKVWEQAFFGVQEAYAFADFDLLVKIDTSYYLADNFKGLSKQQSILDVTGSHVRNLLTVVESALDTFQKHKNWLKNTADLKALTEQDILTKTVPPILTETTKNKGMYRHFGEFLNNKPSLPMAYRISKGQKTVITVDENGQKKELNSSTDIWGFCDGLEFFICQQGAFFPIKIDKTRMTFNGYDLQKQAQKRQTAGLAFGLVGAALSSANKGNLEMMEINMNSGEALPVRD
jgi:hypothetical protein